MTAHMVGPTPKVKRHMEPLHSVVMTKSSSYGVIRTPGAARWTATAKPSTRRLKSNGEKTRIWAIPESTQRSDNAAPKRTWGWVPLKKRDNKLFPWITPCVQASHLLPDAPQSVYIPKENANISQTKTRGPSGTRIFASDVFWVCPKKQSPAAPSAAGIPVKELDCCSGSPHVSKITQRPNQGRHQ